MALIYKGFATIYSVTISPVHWVLCREKTKAALLLGLNNYQTLTNLMDKLGLK